MYHRKGKILISINSIGFALKFIKLILNMCFIWGNHKTLQQNQYNKFEVVAAKLCRTVSNLSQNLAKITFLQTTLIYFYT